MFERVKYNVRLWKLQLQRDRIGSSVRRQVAASMRKEESSHIRGAIRDAAQMDIDELDDDINVLTTQFYLAQARRHFVSAPEAPEMWTRSDIFGSRYLNAAGITKLRSDIRAERKERWDLFQSHAGLVVTLVTSITGVLGAVIGVLRRSSAEVILRGKMFDDLRYRWRLKRMLKERGINWQCNSPNSLPWRPARLGMRSPHCRAGGAVLLCPIHTASTPSGRLSQRR